MSIKVPFPKKITNSAYHISLTLFLIILLNLACQPIFAYEVNPIKIDQFGYLPNSQKIAIISDPQEGFNATDSFTPATNYQVRSAGDDGIAWQADITAWTGTESYFDAEGKKQSRITDVHYASKDRVWWFDFSGLNIAGEYYIYDSVNNVRSENFRIDADIYHETMKHAVRSYYYQRSNFAKQVPFADARWADGASHTSTSRARLLDPFNILSESVDTVRDLSGGWYDAGDYNKYVNNADGPVHELLLAIKQLASF